MEPGGSVLAHRDCEGFQIRRTVVELSNQKQQLSYRLLSLDRWHVCTREWRWACEASMGDHERNRRGKDWEKSCRARRMPQRAEPQSGGDGCHRVPRLRPSPPSRSTTRAAPSSCCFGSYLHSPIAHPRSLTTMPNFLTLCLSLFRVKQVDPPEPHAVAEIVGTRPPSSMSRPGSRMSRPGSRMSMGPSVPTGTVGRRSRDRTRAKGKQRESVPPSAYTPPPSMLGTELGLHPGRRRRPRGGSDATSQPSSIRSTAGSEYTAATVRSVRARYERSGPSEHMKLTHELDNWKKADDVLTARHRRKRSTDSRRHLQASSTQAVSLRVRLFSDFVTD
jgi:hypothetical protein